MTILRIENLSVRFGGLVAVNDVSFRVGAREVVGLIGPNGAGKTTIFNAICGVITPHAGTIELKERAIGGLPPMRIARAGIARTFQNVRLFGELSVRENVMMGAYRLGHCGLVGSMLRLPRHGRLEKEAAERADRWIERVGLRAHAERAATALPFGLQRVAELARAMAGDPELLLLDEPAAGLNTLEKEQLAGLLRQLVVDTRCALLIVEHDMPLVMGLVDRVVVLHFGRKIADGAPAAVARDAAVVEAYLGA